MLWTGFGSLRERDALKVELSGHEVECLGDSIV